MGREPGGRRDGAGVHTLGISASSRGELLSKTETLLLVALMPYPVLFSCCLGCQSHVAGQTQLDKCVTERAVFVEQSKAKIGNNEAWVALPAALMVAH